MCIIAVTPPNLKLDKVTFNRCWDKNPDGFGMAYLIDSKIRIKKTMSKHEAWNIYNGVSNVSNSWKILHFRIGTHGTKDITNCHPFMVHDDLVFAHNGIIRAVPDCPDKLLSDTQMFNNLILKHLPKDFYKWEHYRMLIEEFIGYSKITYLDSDNKVYIYNEEKGEWSDGVWFSNNGYKEVVKYTPPPPPAPPYISSKQPPKHHLEKSICDMTDAEFSAYCKEKYGEDAELVKFNDRQARASRDGHVAADKYYCCEYCMCYKPGGKRFHNLGYLCLECLEDLTNLDIVINDFTTMEELIDAMFDTTKDPNTKSSILSPTDWENEGKEEDEGSWLDWDTYYNQARGASLR